MYLKKMEHVALFPLQIILKEHTQRFVQLLSLISLE